MSSIRRRIAAQPRTTPAARKQARTTNKSPGGSSTGPSATSSPVQQPNSAIQAQPPGPTSPPSQSPSPPASTPDASTTTADVDAVNAGVKRSCPDDEDDNEEMHPIVRLGRHWGRTGDCYAKIKLMLKLGFERRKKIAEAQSVEGADIEDEDEEEEYGIVESRHIAAFERAMEIEPNLEQYISELGAKAVIMMMNTARRNARGEDVKKIKDIITFPRFREWNPPLPEPKDKKARGWNHAEMGRMLCPVEYNFSDSEVQHKLKHRVLRPSPTLYPPFLYKDEKIHQNKFRGFTKSKELGKSGRMLFTGPNTMNGGSPQASSVAKQYDMTEMNMPAIAYTCMIYYFALSSDEKFDPEGKTGFKYRQFYNGLLDHLEALNARQRSIVLTWWNKEVFPDDINPTTELPDGVLPYAQEMLDAGDQDDDDDGDGCGAGFDAPTGDESDVEEGGTASRGVGGAVGGAAGDAAGGE